MPDINAGQSDLGLSLDQIPERSDCRTIRKDLAVDKSRCDFEVVSKHSFEQATNVCCWQQVPISIKIALAKTRPVGDYVSAVDGAANQ